MKQKTTFIKTQDLKRTWHLVDASNVRLGKVATIAAKLLQGKNKAFISRNQDSGDYVVIINAQNVDVHPGKLDRKKYYSHSLYPGGLKEKSLRKFLQEDPVGVIETAIRGMLPQNKLMRGMLNRLKIFKDEKHTFEAQKPKLFKVT